MNERHPFALAFSKRMAQPGCNVRREPHREVLIRLTPQGERFAKQLEGKSEKEQIRMVRERYGDESLRQALTENEQHRKAQGVIRRKQEMLLAQLRAEGDACVRLDEVCRHLELGIEDTFTVIHELNGSLPIGGEPRGDRVYVHCFFDDGTKTVWLECWEADGEERS
jgi:hypothetical protein